MFLRLLLRRVGWLILIKLAIVGFVVAIRKLDWLKKPFIAAFVGWWMRIGARPSDS